MPVPFAVLDLFKTILYVQLSPERITLKNARTGEVISEVPELAISQGPRKRILAVGAQARAAAAQGAAIVVNPFAHPRTLASDFTCAEELLKQLVRRILGRSWLPRSLVIVIHPLGDPAGGYTQVELRAFHEMAVGAGAREVVAYTGRALTDEEFAARRFLADEGKWG